LQDLLPSLALQIQNLSMIERLAREEALDHELKVARKIQESILPKASPQIPGVEILGKTFSGREVGGDYLDFLELSGGRLGLALGDATGMGIPAALLMAGVAQSFRAMASSDRPVSEVLQGMNVDMVRSSSDPQFQGFFAAFFYGLLDPGTGLLSFCNAGMPTPWLLRREGIVERLHRGGPLLGIQEDGHFQEGRVRLNEGDLLFIRSDGLEEQEDEEGELFGEDRLLDWMKINQNRPIDELGEELIAVIENFAGKASKDDISLILLRLNRS
jgi:sigma-B regulation protein RsbU (phosphoserine phosphatase)